MNTRPHRTGVEEQGTVVVAMVWSNLCVVGADVEAVGDVDEPPLGELEVSQSQTGGAVDDVHQVVGGRTAA